MNNFEQYKSWLKGDFVTEELKKELLEIEHDNLEIEDRFYVDLAFGTAGLRGKIGAGTNRMNTLTVARTTNGLANFLNEKYKDNAEDIKVSIAYDSRHKSRHFAETAARVLAANGITVYLFEDLRSTPELSFTVRELKCKAGIVITASHNPKEYNGYKVYNSYGGQILEEDAKSITNHISSIEYSDIKYAELKNNDNIIYIGDEIDKKYIDKVKSLSLNKDLDKSINLIYTPLHGTGNMPVRRVLEELGYKNVFVVSEQEKPDGDFPTVIYPNPEEKSSFDLAIKLAEQKNADLIIGTDPDCDRVGIVVKDEAGKYIVLNGNQTGALLLNYILMSKAALNELPDNGVLVKTIVTSDIGKKIAENFGVHTIETLTGFKYIADKIRQFEEDGDYSFIFGYEESFGYLNGTFVRDKDAVIASMLICEMASFYKKQGKTLLNVLEEIYKQYGFFVEETTSINLEGVTGQTKIKSIIEFFRDYKPFMIGDMKITKYYDYKLSVKHNLLTGDFEKLIYPKSNVLKFIFEDDSWLVIRPSGTEPKMKIYFSFSGKNLEIAKEKLSKAKEDILATIETIR